MPLTILFKRENLVTIDPLAEKICQSARKERWTMLSGIKEWAKITYGATLRSGLYGDWTSIRFKNTEDMNRFKKDFEIAE